jgi:hypothetical protein
MNYKWCRTKQKNGITEGYNWDIGPTASQFMFIDADEDDRATQVSPTPLEQ